MAESDQRPYSTNGPEERDSGVVQRFGGFFGFRRLVGGLLVLAVLVVAVWYIFRDGRLLTQYYRELDPLLLSTSFAVECIGLLLAVPIWRDILSRFARKLSFWEDLRIYSYSMIGTLLPGGIWAAVGRAGFYQSKGIASLSVAAASVVEFILLGIAGLIVFGATTLASNTENIINHPAIGVVVFLGAIIIIQPPILNKAASWLMKLRRDHTQIDISLGYRHLIRWLSGESMVILIGGSAVYLLLRSLISPVPSGTYISVLASWAVANVAGNLFFWMPGTPIIRDGAMLVILSQLLPTGIAVVFVVLVRLWTIGSIITLVLMIWLLYDLNLFRSLTNLITRLLR